MQASAPSRPIDHGLAGAGVITQVLVGKFCDHLPLYRQSQIYARQGVVLERSRLADWVAGAAAPASGRRGAPLRPERGQAPHR
ncbi:MAG: transposase [Polaromonas sp.]